MMKRFTTVALLYVLALAYSPLATARRGGEQDKCRAGGNDNDLQRCDGGTYESWFNFEAKIEKVSKNCDADDSFIMGALVSEVIRKIECSIPEYKGEVFDSEMCELPQEYHMEDDRRLALSNQEFHRHLGTYTLTYQGGGRCRRCRRRRLQALTQPRPSNSLRSLRQLKEATVDAVCSFAATAKLGADIASRSLDSANDNYEEIMDLAAEFYDAKMGAKMVEEAEKELDDCGEHEELAKDEALVTEGWCNEAKEATSAKNMEKCLKGAEKTVKKAMEEAKKVAKSNHKIRDMKHKLMKENVEHEAKEKKEKVKNLIEKMKDDIDDRLDEMERKKKWYERKISRERDDEKKAEYEAQKEALEVVMKRMEQESKDAAKFLEEEAKIDEKVELLQIDLRSADDEDDWLKTFSKLLEEEVPRQLMYYYNSTSGGPGCLDHYPEAKVECWPVEKRDETKPLDECELDFDWT